MDGEEERILDSDETTNAISGTTATPVTAQQSSAHSSPSHTTSPPPYFSPALHGFVFAVHRRTVCWPLLFNSQFISCFII